MKKVKLYHHKKKFSKFFKFYNNQVWNKNIFVYCLFELKKNSKLGWIKLFLHIYCSQVSWNISFYTQVYISGQQARLEMWFRFDY